MIDRRFIENTDWLLILLTSFLISFSLILINSASYQSSENYYNKQLVWLVGSIIAFIIGLIIPYEWLIEKSFFIYILSIIALLIVLKIGTIVSGSKSWIRISWISFQPSEFAKIASILLLASYLGKKESKELSFKHFINSSLIVLLPIVLILLQPDLGTSIVFIFLFFFMLYAAGFSITFLIFLILAGISLFPIVYLFLKPYQKARLLTFLDPQSDPLGAGYQIIQSKIAIGSGGFFGKGFLKGSQTHLNFIPAKHTDFILSILGEEWGFLGISLLLIIYLLFLLKALQNAKKAKDKSGSLLILGCLSLIITQALINIGMVIGLMPITGLPLPFISYGGSSLLTSILSLSLILNVTMRRLPYY